MGSHKDIDYRLELARGFLNEAEQDYSLKRWRACVSGSILVLENSGLAVLMLFGEAVPAVAALFERSNFVLIRGGEFGEAVIQHPARDLVGLAGK